MTGAPFGFSVGDFIAAIRITRTAINALKDAGGATDDFQALLLELQSLQTVLEALLNLPATSSTSQNHYNAVRGMACQAQVPLQSFVVKMQAEFGQMDRSQSSPSSSRWKSPHQQIKWALSMSKEVQELRSVIIMKMVSMSVLLAMPTQGALAHITTRLTEIEETQRNTSDSLGNVAARMDEIYQGQAVMRTQMENATPLAGVDSRKLLRICFGLQAGVQKLNQQMYNTHRLTQLATARQSMNSRSVCASLASSSANFRQWARASSAVVHNILSTIRDLSRDIRELFEKLHRSNTAMYDLLLQIYSRLPQQPTTQLEDNITFTDALNRRSHLPYAYFQHWEVFKAMLEVRFADMPGERKVHRGQYLLMDHRSLPHRITPQQWTRYVLPGVEIAMSVMVSQVARVASACPRPQCPGSDQTSRVQSRQSLEW